MEVWVFSLSVFFIAPAPIFFGKEDDPYSMRIELLEGSIALDRPFEMDMLIVEILGFVVRGIVWRRWISILLVFCNVTNKIHKRTDTTLAFTQEYSRVSYPLRNVSTLSTGSGSSKDTHRCRRVKTERTS